MSSNTITEIFKLVQAIENLDELFLVSTMLQNKHKDLRNRAKFNFRVGQRVSFPARNGTQVTGIIDKINRKNVKVRADGGLRWNVSPVYLKAA
jgi:hypothetical protein